MQVCVPSPDAAAWACLQRGARRKLRFVDDILIGVARLLDRIGHLSAVQTERTPTARQVMPAAQLRALSARVHPPGQRWATPRMSVRTAPVCVIRRDAIHTSSSVASDHTRRIEGIARAGADVAEPAHARYSRARRAGQLSRFHFACAKVTRGTKATLSAWQPIRGVDYHVRAVGAVHPFRRSRRVPRMVQLRCRFSEPNLALGQRWARCARVGSAHPETSTRA